MINIVLGIHGGIDGDVGGPFFYSRTCCCGASGTSLELPPHFDIWYPRTCNHYTMCKGGFNVTFVKACDVPWLNPDQPAWSHSPYCQNWDYVRDLFEPGMIEDMFAAYVDVLHGLAASDACWHASPRPTVTTPRHLESRIRANATDGPQSGGESGGRTRGQECIENKVYFAFFHPGIFKK